LAAKLGDRLLLDTVARVVARDNSGSTQGFRVTVRTNDGVEKVIVADDVVVATPTSVAATLLRGIDSEIADRLAEIEYAPIAVVSLGYPKSELGDSVDGFGFLIPRSAGVRTLGTVWNSSLFPNRAPNGQVLLTSFIGGATDPEAVKLSPDEVAAIVHKELSTILRIRVEPTFLNVSVYSRALPQYNLGHSGRLAAIEAARQKGPNLWIAGNYLRGPAIGACVEQSIVVAQEIISRRGH